MLLQQYLERTLPAGLSYAEATQLCQRLFCTVDGLPAQVTADCTKDGLAATFASLTRTRWVAAVPAAAATDARTVRHWLDILGAVLTTDDLDTAPGARILERVSQVHADRDDGR